MKGLDSSGSQQDTLHREVGVLPGSTQAGPTTLKSRPGPWKQTCETLIFKKW